MEISGDLLEFINAEVSLDPSEEIVLETDLLLTGFVDSVGVIEIVSWLEDEVGVEIDPVHVVHKNFKTVGRMLELVDRLQAGREGLDWEVTGS